MDTRDAILQLPVDAEIARLRAEVKELQELNGNLHAGYTKLISDNGDLRAEVARLLGNLDVCGEQRSHAEKREMALRDEVARLKVALGTGDELSRKSVKEITRLRDEVARLTRERDVNANWPAMYAMYSERVTEEKTGRRNAEAERDALRACVTQLVGALSEVWSWRIGTHEPVEGSLWRRIHDALAAAEKLTAPD